MQSIYDINYLVLNLSDTIAVLNAIYLQDDNRACASEMFGNGELYMIAVRLEG